MGGDDEANNARSAPVPSTSKSIEADGLVVPAIGKDGRSAPSGGGAGSSIFGNLQSLAERAHGQRGAKKKERQAGVRRKQVAIDDDAQYNPQVCYAHSFCEHLRKATRGV